MRKRLTTVMASRGRVYDPKRPTTPAAATGQTANPEIEFKMVRANTQRPCSRPSSDSDIGTVDTLGVNQGNSQPSMTRTNGGRDSEAIRISRNGLQANPVMILRDRGCGARARTCD